MQLWAQLESILHGKKIYRNGKPCSPSVIFPDDFQTISESQKSACKQLTAMNCVLEEMPSPPAQAWVMSTVGDRYSLPFALLPQISFTTLFSRTDASLPHHLNLHSQTFGTAEAQNSSETGSGCVCTLAE